MTIVNYDGSANDFILEVDVVLAVAADGQKELSDVVRVERGRLRRQTGGKVRIAWRIS